MKKTEQNSQKTKKQVTIKGAIVAVLLVLLALWYFNHLGNRSSIKRNEAQKTEIQTLMEYDMTLDYPKTPRDVAKLHNRYFKVFYGQELTDEELDAMNKKVRQLYCMDLLVQNPESGSLENLKNDIQELEELGYIYKMYELPEASQIQTFTRDGKEMASMEVCITINTGDALSYLYRQYVMVKENDQWKIYGWTTPQQGDN